MINLDVEEVQAYDDGILHKDRELRGGGCD
jgi:hypothetical protein